MTDPSSVLDSDTTIRKHELGDALAYTDVGWIYESGELGKPNIPFAVECYQMAEKAGEEHAVEALKRLGYQ